MNIYGIINNKKCIIGEMDDSTDNTDEETTPKDKKKNKPNKKKHNKETASNRKPHGRKPLIEDLGVKPKTGDKSKYSIYDDHVETDING